MRAAVSTTVRTVRTGTIYNKLDSRVLGVKKP
jgi:hypothetical protein